MTPILFSISFNLLDRVLRHIFKEKNKKLQKLASDERKKPKFSINDYVRITKFKKHFEKGFSRNWSTEIFKVVRLNKKFPFTYILEDYEGMEIAGIFYENEMQKVKNSDSYLVERVIRKKGNKSFVKWLGFSSLHNSWVPNSQII